MTDICSNRLNDDMTAVCKKLTEEQIDKAIGEYPNVGFDICSVCNEVQEYGTMSDITEESFDLICDDCQKSDYRDQEQSSNLE